MSSLPSRSSRCALDQIDVESAVIIVIEQGHARTHDLGHVVAAGGEIEVAEVESGLRLRHPERSPAHRMRRGPGHNRPATPSAPRRSRRENVLIAASGALSDRALCWSAGSDWPCATAEDMRLLEIFDGAQAVTQARIGRAQRVETGGRLFALRLQAPEEMRDRLLILLLVDQDAAEVKPRQRIVRPVRDGFAEMRCGVIQGGPAVLR